MLTLETEGESGSGSWVSDGWQPDESSPGVAWVFSKCCLNSTRGRMTFGQQTPGAQTLRSERNRHTQACGCY